MASRDRFSHCETTAIPPGKALFCWVKTSPAIPRNSLSRHPPRRAAGGSWVRPVRALIGRIGDRTSGKKCSLGFSELFSSGRRIAIRPGTAYCWRAPLKTPFLAPAVTTRPWEGGKYFSMAIPSLRLREDITPHTFSHWATPLHKSYRVLQILASGVPKRCFTPILTHAHLAVGSQWHTPHVMGSKVSQLSQL